MLDPLKIVSLFLGWLFAFVIEKRYICRSTQIIVILSACELAGGDVFLGSFLETSDFWLAWELWEAPEWVKIYLCFGVLLGVIGLLFYLGNKSLSKGFYDLSYWLYSSKTVMPLTTAIALFTYNDPAFFSVCGFLFCLAWFPKFTVIGLLLLMGYAHFKEH